MKIEMTLTSPGCPVGDLLKSGVIATAKRMDGVAKVDVKFVWQPMWNPTFMSEEAKITLGYDI